MLSILPDKIWNSQFMIISWESFTVAVLLTVSFLLFKIVSHISFHLRMREYLTTMDLRSNFIDHIKTMCIGVAVDIENDCEAKIENDHDYEFTDEDAKEQLTYAYKTIMDTFSADQLRMILTVWEENTFKQIFAVLLTEAREFVRSGRNIETTVAFKDIKLSNCESNDVRPL